ncbi:hypothetical protein BDU57DRAFT_566338 [Ampelomyces quisqualis]|uniref:Uncharacterized protein n=1 Tax=Ampelomyces quisqualis TaxID=50730 RepID=A0A6A5Q8Y4_AMPQU|nr:hypothetical protein BDU57DRAFT_566338 [Ampelomyces quisqualis]
MTVNGDLAMNNTVFLSISPLEAGGRIIPKLPTKEARSSQEGTTVLCDSAPIPNSRHIFVTNASLGAAVLKLNRAAQPAWPQILMRTTQHILLILPFSRVADMSLEYASIIAQLDLSDNGDLGVADIKSAGSFMYALLPGYGTSSAASTVLNVSSGQGSMNMAQCLDLSGIAGCASVSVGDSYCLQDRFRSVVQDIVTFVFRVP